MLTPAVKRPASPILYPESDGKPLAENTRQLQWIFTLVGNLVVLFRDRPDVFVSGDQLWYPIEGEPDVRAAPDAYVVFGRPKGHRGSYKQWEEGGIPMTVVFEVLSPSNGPVEMAEKLTFYEDHGVEEYYVYDPDTNWLGGYVRQGSVLRRMRPMNGFVSPRLGIGFDLSGPEMVVRYPDGRPFLTFEELETERRRAEQRAEKAEQQAVQAKQRAEQAERQVEQAEQRAGRLAELSQKVLRQQATPEEVQELQSLLASPPPSGSAAEQP
jgi:Uma2 family endonuclease